MTAEGGHRQAPDFKSGEPVTENETALPFFRRQGANSTKKKPAFEVQAKLKRS